ncbi:MAG: gliding motility-associated C-terminal domain-containing protein [Crocinitomicaceae bacterium]|nr:gliding motility-associated C-terminal domain-containing protein [Crocinitomicaceae bacterium]
MKSITTLLTIIALVFLGFFSNAQRGKDGNLNVTSPNNVLNTYTYLTATPGSGVTSLTVANNSMNGGAFATNLSAGDLIMIIQMQGASADIADIIGCCGGVSASSFSDFWNWWTIYDLFGSVTNYNESGTWEIQEVASVTGANIINLQCQLNGNYNHTDHVQVVRIPRFDNLTVSGGSNSIIPSQWDGNSGGIVALEVDGVLNIEGGSSISASGFGFRGGQVDLNGISGGIGNPTEDRFPGTNDSFHAAEKGEGIYGYHAEYDAVNSRYGRGAATNGGGGGSHQNCGGGGGSNISPVTAGYTGNGVPTGAVGPWNLEANPIGGTNTPGGGRGGYAYSNTNLNELTTGPDNASWGGDARKDNGGLGGHPLAYDANRIFFGGGGGAGDQDSFGNNGNGPGEAGAGGAGGGIVYIQSFGTITGSGTIESNGADGENTNPNNNPLNPNYTRRGNDGAGGAGGGGSIYIENAAVIPNTISLNANGGNGGDQNLTLALGELPEAGGPGGGGGGGYVAFNGGSPNQSVLGGSNGVSNSAHVSNFPQNGATAGNVGVSGMPSKYYDLTISDITICENTSADLSVTILGSIPAGATVNWYDSQFGYDATPLSSGTTFNTGVLTATTTYYIGICPGPTNFRVPVTVTVTAEPNLNISNPAVLCAPNSADITLGAVTAGSDAGVITYWTDMAATSALGTPSAVGAGTYYIQLDAGGGCTTVEPVTVTIEALEDASYTTSATCDGGTVTVTGTIGGTFTFNTTPVDGAAINGSTGEITGGTPGTTYDILYVTPGTCFASSVQSVTALVADDASFSTIPSCDGGVVNISGTLGGTFTFNSPPGDAAIINASTGEITGGISGTTYDILYTTAGVCPASSNVTVTASSVDDASFSLTTACDGATALVTGTPGGTFSFNTAPGDAAVINAITGEITGGTGGTTYDVMYATTGACAASTTSTIMASSTDDASFSLVATCDGATAVIGGTTGGIFTFNTTPLDAAVIDGSTGEITGGTAGASYDVVYATSGACAANSTESITVLTQDIATYTTTSTCDGGTVGVTGTPGGTFSFNTSPTDAAVIDPTSGTVSGGSFNTVYDILYTTSGVCPANLNQTLISLEQDDASFSMTALCDGGVASLTGTTGGVFSFNVAPGDAAIINASSGLISGGTPNTTYDVIYTTLGACPNSSVESVTTLIQDDASFTTTASCDGGTTSITGTTGGTFTFDIAPLDGALIDASTGVITNGTSGSTYDILYTTSGTCFSTNVVSVTVLNEDDATFSLTPACDGGTSAISGTPGGVFNFASVPGDAATIDSNTGLVSNATSGASYDIVYTTSGVCSSNSTQTLTVLTTDDPTFTISPTCDGGVSSILGTAGGVFSFSIAPVDGAIIDAVTGLITGGTSGSSYDVLYTTLGVCSSSLVVTVTTNTIDDPSFSLTPTCDGATASLTGTTGGSFDFVSPPADGAVIDAVTGEITGGTSGATYDVNYATSGQCGANQTVSVIVLTTDDPTFIITPSCAGGTSIVSGELGGAFSFETPPTDGALINDLTGEVTNGISGNSYNILYTTNGVCPASLSLPLTVLSPDDATFSLIPTCDGAVAQLLTSDGGTFDFDLIPTDGAVINTLTGEVTGGDYNSTYSISYTTTGDCPVVGVELVTVNDCSVDEQIVIPTAFTPDNDGSNDTWEILEMDNKYPENVVRIYNRWGDVIFEHYSSVSEPYNSNRWDGTYKGSLMPVGSYYFIIDLNDSESTKETGTVSIILNK